MNSKPGKRKKKSPLPRGKLNIDLGCGENVQRGFVGMDMRELPGVEIVHDLEVFPWPLKDGSVNLMMASHLVEHIKPWFQIQFMDEAWRVLKTGSAFLISTPYGGSFRYNQDPTHCAPWNEATVAYFVKGMELFDVYKPKPWKLERVNFFIQGDLEVVLIKIDEDK